jgi:hypothetical protein
MVVVTNQTQNECYGFPTTWRRTADMHQGVSTSEFGQLTFCIAFTVKTFFRFILMPEKD